MINLTKIDTEGRNFKSKDIDQKSVAEILKIINHEDSLIAQEINRKIKKIETAVNLIGIYSLCHSN